jgi:thiol:disulfide interchange protein DsbC
MSAISSWRSRLVALGAGALLLAGAVFAADDATVAATIRTTLAKRLPNLPHIDEITKSPLPGLWEVRLGSQVIYSDAQGSFVIEGEIIDTARHVNLTQDRVDALTAFDFGKLPLQDAVVWKQGTGARKLVVFADPNCGYCKKFERDLQSVKDVTVYTFLYPILGPDSTEKSKQIWCAKDNIKVWRDWMIKGTPIAESGTCDTSVLSRNVALGRKHRITGTPGLVYEDGKMQPGAVGAEAVERQLVASRAKGNS